MVSRVSLQDIINADWSKQYLDNNGEVKNKSCSYDFFGIGPKLVKLLRHVPFIGALFPKADIIQATDAVKAKISNLLNNGTSENDPELKEAAKKVNQIVRKVIIKISDTKTNPSNALWDAYININALKPLPDWFKDDEDDIDDNEEVPPTTPEKVADKVNEQVPTTPEKTADVRKEETTPATPANTQSTPLAETPADDARIEVLHDDAEETPTAPQPKANDPVIVLTEHQPEALNNAGVNSPACEEFIFDDEPEAKTPPLPRLVETEVREEAPAVEKVIEKVPDPTPETFEKDLREDERTVAKVTEKASTRVEEKKRRKEHPGTKQKKVVVHVKDKQVKPVEEAPKKGRKNHVDKKTKR